MKYLFLLITICFSFSTTCYSQTRKRSVPTNKNTKVQTKSVEITKSDFIIKNGLITANDGTDFKIIKANGYTQKELYTKILLGISKLYPDLDKVTTKIENEEITVNGFTKLISIIHFSDRLYGKFEAMFGGRYTIKFLFKDGKIRIDAPRWSNLRMTSPADGTDLFQLHELVLLDPTCSPKFETKINEIIDSIIEESFSSANNNW